MAKTTIVLVHGAGGGGWEWDWWRPALVGAGFGFVAPDLRPGPGGLAATTLDQYRRQVIGWAPRRGRVVLVGASMGGPLALLAAATVQPAALVLVNAVAPQGVGPQRAVPKPHPSIVRWANGTLTESRDAMPDSDDATVRRAWKRWRDESGAVMDALSAGVAVEKPKAPTLCVLGENDTDVPQATGRALAAWAGADTHAYAGMSHVGPLLGRRADEVARGVVAWLRARDIVSTSR